MQNNRSSIHCRQTRQAHRRIIAMTAFQRCRRVSYSLNLAGDRIGSKMGANALHLHRRKHSSLATARDTARSAAGANDAGHHNRVTA
jgi:hypothetical protein